MTEKSIAKFKYENNIYKLLKQTTWEYDINIIDIELNKQITKYIIIRNRKRLYNTKWLETAKKKFTQIIATELLQQKITF